MSGMDVARPEADDRVRRGDLDALPGRGRPAGRLRQHPEEGGLVQPEPAVPRPDAEHDLLWFDQVAVAERLELGLGRVGRRKHVAQEVLGLVDAAQDSRLAGEDLHGHDGIEPFALEDRLGASEVDVRRIAGQDLRRGPRSTHPHQPDPAPVSRSSGTAPLGGPSGVAASVAYGCVASGSGPATAPRPAAVPDPAAAPRPGASMRHRSLGSIGCAMTRLIGRDIDAANTAWL